MTEQEQLLLRLQQLEARVDAAKAEIRQEIKDEVADLRRGLQEVIRLLSDR